jgi:hypothetical protein
LGALTVRLQRKTVDQMRRRRDGRRKATAMTTARSTLKTLVPVLVAALMLAATLVAASQTDARADAKAGWRLIDNHQRSCYVSSRGGTSYYGIWISGSWTRRINVGASDLPTGASYYTSYAPIPPGSSDGVGSLAYVAVVLPAGASVGSYTSQLWAAVGKARQTVPITEVVQSSSCSHY